MAELKPCPFCGTSDVILVYGYWVRCLRCGVYGPAGTRAEAIEAWNRRAEDGK